MIAVREMYSTSTSTCSGFEIYLLRQKQTPSENSNLN